MSKGRRLGIISLLTVQLKYYHQQTFYRKMNKPIKLDLIDIHNILDFKQYYILYHVMLI